MILWQQHLGLSNKKPDDGSRESKNVQNCVTSFMDDPISPCPQWSHYVASTVMQWECSKVLKNRRKSCSKLPSEVRNEEETWKWWITFHCKDVLRRKLDPNGFSFTSFFFTNDNLLIYFLCVDGSAINDVTCFWYPMALSSLVKIFELKILKFFCYKIFDPLPFKT